MELSKDKVELLSREPVEETTVQPPAVKWASTGTEDPEARQGRKLALMASLSEGLPTLPAYVFELNSLLTATPVNLKRVVEVIMTDPSLTAQVLRLCNSAFMGFRERVTKAGDGCVIPVPSGVRTTEELPAGRAESPDGTGRLPVPPIPNQTESK